MQAIDVDGLPEPVAEALQLVVRTLRQQYGVSRPQRTERRRIELPRWPLKPIGRLSREEIYEDV